MSRPNNDRNSDEAKRDGASPGHAPVKAAPPAVVVSRVLSVNAAAPPPPRAPVPQPEPSHTISKPPPPSRAQVPTRTATMKSFQAVAQPAAAGVALDDDGPPTEPGVPVSHRPQMPPVDIAAHGDGHSLADTFDRLLNVVDAQFDSILDDGSAQDTRFLELEPSSGELRDVRALFADLAANHMRQVRDFMIDVKWGEATRDWIPICTPAVRSLRGAAGKLSLHALAEALEKFGGALDAANGPAGEPLDPATRTVLDETYSPMIDLLPGAFTLEKVKTQREAVIVQSLLLQIPEVRKVTMDRLYASGLSSLETMYLANADDLAATAGIDRALAARIVQKFQAHRAEMKTTAPDAARAPEREKVAELAAKLREQNRAFEAGRDDAKDDDAAKKKHRELRKAREETFLQLKVVVARLGEVDLLKELERLPMEKRVARLEKFLDDAQGNYGG